MSDIENFGVDDVEDFGVDEPTGDAERETLLGMLDELNKQIAETLDDLERQRLRNVRAEVYLKLSGHPESEWLELSKRFNAHFDTPKAFANKLKNHGGVSDAAYTNILGEVELLENKRRRRVPSRKQAVKSARKRRRNRRRRSSLTSASLPWYCTPRISDLMPKSYSTNWEEERLRMLRSMLYAELLTKSALVPAESSLLEQPFLPYLFQREMLKHLGSMITRGPMKLRILQPPRVCPCPSCQLLRLHNLPPL
jgi:hypothetical protein